MRVIIAGSRGIHDLSVVEEAVRESGWEHEIEVVVSGTAKGVDTLGERWAERHIGLKQVDKYRPDWKKFGKRAGFVRNQEMALNADALIAVWDGRSTGTKHMIDLANEMELEVFIKRVNK